MTRYILGGTAIGLGLITFPQNTLSDSEHKDMMLYWRAAMFGLGIATLVFPTPVETRYTAALAQESTAHFFIKPTTIGINVGYTIDLDDRDVLR